jgi:nucleoid DNA-binding protein
MAKRNEVKQEIYREVAAETGGTIQEIQKCVEAQFSFIEKIIKRGEFDTVRMPYLAKFSVKPGRVKMLNNKNAIIQRRKLSGNS